MISERRSDEAAIRELLDRQVAGWDAGDAEAYASVFTPDADYVTFLGSHYRGRDAIAASYIPLFAKLLKGSQLKTDITQASVTEPVMGPCRIRDARNPAQTSWTRSGCRLRQDDIGTVQRDVSP